MLEVLEVLEGTKPSKKDVYYRMGISGEWLLCSMPRVVLNKLSVRIENADIIEEEGENEPRYNIGSSIKQEDLDIHDKENCVSDDIALCSDSYDTSAHLIPHDGTASPDDTSSIGAFRSSVNRSSVNRKPYICEICGKRFRKYMILQCHMQIHKTETPSTVNECDEINIDNNNIQASGEPHDSFQHCSEDNLKKITKTEEKDQLYQCVVCSKGFYNLNHLKRHLRVHTGIKPYRCEDCGKCFNRFGNLKVHMLTHTGIKPYKCEHCSKGFTQYVSLKTHLEAHAGIKPFECEYCDKRFSQRGNMEKHVRTHTGEKPYECEVCDKCFTNSTHLKRHSLVHTGAKPFECGECKKCFRDSSTLKTHRRIHTGVRPYVCGDCGKGFYNNSNMKQHMRTHNKSTGTKSHGRGIGI